MVENGHVGRDSYGAEEKVAEGEVKEKDCGSSPEVGELVAVPGEDYGSWRKKLFYKFLTMLGHRRLHKY